MWTETRLTLSMLNAWLEYLTPLGVDNFLIGCDNCNMIEYDRYQLDLSCVTTKNHFGDLRNV